LIFLLIAAASLFFGIFLPIYAWDLRRRLRKYEDDRGDPRILDLNPIKELCRDCGGPLILGEIEDDWGPKLTLASNQFIRADGQLIYEPAEADVELADSTRGFGSIAWCSKCETFTMVTRARRL
jgi:hypothetical protein